MKSLVLHIVFLITPVIAYPQEFNATFSSDDSIQIGEHRNIHLEIRFPASSNDLPIFAYYTKGDMLSPAVEIIEVKDTEEQTEGAVNIFSKDIIVTGWNTGSLDIPPFAAEFEGDSIYSNSLTLNIKTDKINTSSPPKDIKDIYEADWTALDEVLYWLKNYWWVLLILVLLPFLIIFIVKRYRKSKEQKASALPDLPPQEIALLMLNKVEEAQLLKEGRVKTYYTGITDALRKFLELKFGIPTLDQTSDEILKKVRHTKINKTQYDLLSNIFAKASLVKFAKSTPGEEDNRQIMHEAREFIHTTSKIDTDNADN